jgi:hypothetical protein
VQCRKYDAGDHEENEDGNTRNHENENDDARDLKKKDHEGGNVDAGKILKIIRRRWSA